MVYCEEGGDFNTVNAKPYKSPASVVLELGHHLTAGLLRPVPVPGAPHLPFSSGQVTTLVPSTSVRTE